MPVNQLYSSLFFYLISWICLPISCISQGEKIDSLKSVLLVEEDLKTRIDLYNELAWQLRRKDTSSAISYAEAAIQLSQKTHNERGESTAYLRLGEIHRLKRKYTKGLLYFEKALSLEKSLKYDYGIGRAYFQITLCYKGLDSLDNANASILNAIQTLEGSSHLILLARAFHQHAIINQKLNNHEVAIESLKRKVVLSERLNDPILSCTTNSFLGKIYDELGSLDQSKTSYLNALNVWDTLGDYPKWAETATDLSTIYIKDRDFDAAIKLINKSIQISDSLSLFETLAINYNNLGVIAEKEGSLERARDFYLKSIKLKQELSLTGALGINHYNVGNIYNELNQWDSALYYYRRSSFINSSDMSLQMKTYWDIVQVFIRIEKIDSANKYLEKYGVLRDSTDRMLSESVRAMDNMEQTLKQQELLQRDNEIQRVSIEKKNQMIYGLIVILFLMIGIGFSIFRSYRLRQRSLLAEKEAEIKDGEIKDLLKGHKIKLLDDREKERNRMARDLHDRLGGKLSVVKMYMKSIEDNLKGVGQQNLDKYTKANSLLDEACDEVRQVAHNLESGVLRKFGLVPAIRSLQKTVNSTGQLRIELLHFGFDDEEDSNRLDREIETFSYRIMEELLSNVLKHAEAKEMTIQLFKKKENLNILVEDDGVGFNPQKVSRSGMGIQNIMTRVERLNGKIIFDSGKGSGTTITLEIPLNHD